MDGALKSSRSIDLCMHHLCKWIIILLQFCHNHIFFLIPSESTQKNPWLFPMQRQNDCFDKWGKTFSALTMIFKMTNLKYGSPHEPTIITPWFSKTLKRKPFYIGFFFFLIEKINVKTDYVWHSLWMSQKQSYHVENMTKCNLNSSS